jgi:hypothetical protein
MKPEYYQLIHDYIGKAQKVQQRYMDQGRTNNTTYNGFLIDVDDELSTTLGRYPLNALTNLIQTWVSLILESRPSAVAFAATSELDDLYSAKISNAVIRYLSQELDENTCLFELVKKAALYGTSGLKVIYNPETDRVEWTPLSLAEFYIDPNQTQDGPRWVIFKSMLQEDELPPGIKYFPTDYINDSGESLSAQIVYELWLKPCSTYPKGIYCKLAGDQIYDEGPFPYIFPDDSKPRAQLPIVLFKVRRQEGSVFGRTPVSDCIACQRLVNEYNSEITQLTRQSTNNFLVVPQSIASRLDLSKRSGLKVITFDNNLEANHAGNIKYTDTPTPPSQLYQERDYQTSKLTEIIGINGVTAGTDTKARSGTAIQRLYELDGLKNADAAKSLGQAILRAWQLSLNLVRSYYSGSRQAKISGEDPIYWNSADLAGIDVTLEPGSAYDRYSAVRQEAGDPTLPNRFSALAVNQAKQVSEMYLSGGRVELLPEDTTPELLEELQKISDKLLFSGKREDARDLDNFIKQLGTQLTVASDTTAADPGEPNSTNTPPADPASRRPKEKY